MVAKLCVGFYVMLVMVQSGLTYADSLRKRFPSISRQSTSTLLKVLCTQEACTSGSQQHRPNQSKYTRCIPVYPNRYMSNIVHIWLIYKDTRKYTNLANTLLSLYSHFIMLEPLLYTHIQSRSQHSAGPYTVIAATDKLLHPSSCLLVATLTIVLTSFPLAITLSCPTFDKLLLLLLLLLWFIACFTSLAHLLLPLLLRTLLPSPLLFLLLLPFLCRTATATPAATCRCIHQHCFLFLLTIVLPLLQLLTPLLKYITFQASSCTHPT